jgi:hypothetical protein
MPQQSMNIMKTRLIAGVSALILTSGVSQATLIGESVHGSLQFGGGSANYFDPANGFVPGGGVYLNEAGATVTIGEPAVEFGFQDGANRDIANFTATQLIITDLVMSSATNWQMDFTSSAFLGASISEVSDTFGNGGVNASILGNVITLTWAGASSQNDFRAVYNIQTTGVPDSGSSLAMLGISLFGLFRVRRLLRSNP